MSRTRSVMVTTLWLAAALGLASPARALAAGDWAWPVDGSVAVAYGARYTSALGTSCTHGGVDLTAPEGAIVHACSGGEVVFSGQVPAGEGERAWAVTVLTADGLRVTYLPLRRASVTKGATIDAGVTIGELAGEGDASSPASHLHLGVRRGEARLDPMSFLGEHATAAVSGPITVPVPETPHPVVGSAPAPAHAAAPTANAASGARAPAVAPATAHASARVPSSARSSSAQTPAFLPRVSPIELPTLRQFARAADTPRLRTAAVTADVGSARDFLAALLARLGLAGVAGFFVWPVLRGVLDGHSQRVPATVAVRRDGA